jgi:hypothetical protein
MRLIVLGGAALDAAAASEVMREAFCMAFLVFFWRVCERDTLCNEKGEKYGVQHWRKRKNVWVYWRKKVDECSICFFCVCLRMLNNRTRRERAMEPLGGGLIWKRQRYIQL